MTRGRALDWKLTRGEQRSPDGHDAIRSAPLTTASGSKNSSLLTLFPLNCCIPDKSSL
ncbi:hypothetical protein QJS10_CPB20g00601 [Acorus calamus]|uniref:Uncharacterized protein n=1 Tax=Acorus calamus TaxID=4465 RepID=A0AAV9CF86_ACOCL|nr:hypothetical protein QJS10_CPB20g00601 [Acorus calamus]